MSNPNKTCFFPEPHESRCFGFGSSFVANNKYLAVGHTGLNKVIIYAPNDSGKWKRNREIKPPVDLALDREDSIFGNGLELDGDVLTISARIRNPDVSRDSLSSSQAVNTSPKYSYRRFLINLKTDTKVKPIDLLVQREPESNLIRFNPLRKGKIKTFILPDMGEEYFGNNVALHRNLLLAGYSSSYDETGGAWLFDLDRPQAKPIKITVEDAALGSEVAISQQFAAVGFHGVTWRYPSSNARRKSPTTLIKNLNNGSSMIIDSFGELSLSDDILAVMRPGSPDCEQSPLLEVFRLDEDTTPYLITRRTDVIRAKVQNSFLITYQINSLGEVCIEPLP